MLLLRIILRFLRKKFERKTLMLQKLNSHQTFNKCHCWQIVIPEKQTLHLLTLDISLFSLQNVSVVRSSNFTLEMWHLGAPRADCQSTLGTMATEV